MTKKTKIQKRDRILATALGLFNEKGSHKVTTNHIAKAMGISPGNLYYHFNNKEHIIRELLAQLIEKYDALIALPEEGRSGLDLIAATLEATGDLIYRYRFIYVELAALLVRDPGFETMYRAIKARRAEEFLLLIEVFEQMGVFRQPLSSQERDAVIFIIWTYAEGMVTALMTSGIRPTRKAIQSHVKKIPYILKPYLKPDPWTRLALHLGLE